MAKIMLVEDDKSLREIYSIRLVAEGYEVVSAGDGEEALAIAVQQKPDLIVSDVMMPKISGFDMLDILRSTPETKDIKVMMMTALSSEEQRQRGESLGADKYLVKSQVGIEDVINAVHSVLGDRKDDTAGTDTSSADARLAGSMPNTASSGAPASSSQSPAGPSGTTLTAPQAQPAPQPVQPVQPAPTSTAAQMDALLNENPGVPGNASWPGTSAQ